MRKISCLLVDDEPPAIMLLEKYLSMLDSFEVVGSCSNAVKAFEFLSQNEVDLMLLDIRMPVLNGIDFLKSLQHPPSVILTTAYREYAIEGYDLDIVDYLLKPIAFDRFLKAVNRYQDQCESKFPEHIYVNVNRTQHKVVLAEIIYIESLKDYVRIHMMKEKLVVKGNLGTFMKLLPSGQFLRIHRSFAIALAQVKSFSQSEVAVGGVKLPIGVSYKGVLPL